MKANEKYQFTASFIDMQYKSELPGQRLSRGLSLKYERRRNESRRIVKL